MKLERCDCGNYDEQKVEKQEKIPVVALQAQEHTLEMSNMEHEESKYKFRKSRNKLDYVMM